MLSIIGIVAIVLVSTFLVGSFIGYAVHWLMHSKWTRYKILRPLLRIHNAHHSRYHIKDFESETYRDSGKEDSAIIFIPTITFSIIILSVVFWFAFHAWWVYPIMLAEGVLVGWLNTDLHRCFHIKDHWLNKYSWFQELKRLHWLHHKHPRANHGIIWFGLDRVFGTFRNN